MTAKRDCGALEQHGLRPKDWEAVFRRAGVATDKIDAAKSHRAKTTIIGNFLSTNLGREVPIEWNGRPAIARLCVQERRAREKTYYFEIRPVAACGEHDRGSVGEGVAGEGSGDPLRDVTAAGTLSKAQPAVTGELGSKGPANDTHPGSQIGHGNQEEWSG